MRDCTFIASGLGNRGNSTRKLYSEFPVGHYVLENVWFEDCRFWGSFTTGYKDQCSMEDFVFRNVRSNGPAAFLIQPRVPVRNWVFDGCTSFGNHPIKEYKDLSFTGNATKSMIETNTFIFKENHPEPTAVPTPIGTRIEAEALQLNGCQVHKPNGPLSGAAAVAAAVKGRTGTVSGVWQGETGVYTVVVRYYDALGKSHVTLTLGDGEAVGTWSSCREDGDWHLQRFPEQHLKKGQPLRLQFKGHKEELLIDYIEIQ
jgi:hypothetical protein